MSEKSTPNARAHPTVLQTRADPVIPCGYVVLLQSRKCRGDDLVVQGSDVPVGRGQGLIHCLQSDRQAVLGLLQTKVRYVRQQAAATLKAAEGGAQRRARQPGVAQPSMLGCQQ
jgi:hypothetical protein